MTGSAAVSTETGNLAPPGEAPELERALATAALRVADGLSGLGLATGARVTRRLAVPDAFDGIDERALCLLIDPPGHDALKVGGSSPEVMATRTGLVALDPALTDALIEVQTIGHVDGPARPPRRPTRIDAALAQPFARAILDQLCRQIAPDCREPRPGRLRSGSFVAGPASLGLILTAPRYLRLDLELRLGDGARKGMLSLILPLFAAPIPEGPVAAPDPEADWAQAMREAASGAPVRLEAVLPRMRLPLSRLMTLAVGDLIPLDPMALADVTLHGGSSGVTMAGRKRLPRGASMNARLGQLNGVRAIKIAALPGQTVDQREADPDTGSDFGMDALGFSRPADAAMSRMDATPGGSEYETPAMQDLPDPPVMDDASPLDGLPGLSATDDGLSSTGLPDLPSLP